MSDLYTAEDAQRILQIAIAKDTESGELSRVQLLEIAQELGIAAETVAAAEREWLVLQDEASEQGAFQTYRRQRFQHRLMRYAIINGFLAAIDLLMGNGLGFSLYVMLFWGMGLSLQGWKAYQQGGYRYQKDYEKWRRDRLVQETFGNLVGRVNRFLRA